MTRDLKPCPFCGAGSDRIILTVQEPHTHLFATFMPDHPGSATIECGGCCVGMIEDSVEKVAAAWNRRSTGLCASAETGKHHRPHENKGVGALTEQPEREAPQPYGYIVEWWDGKRTFEETLPRKFGGSAVSAREVYDHPAAVPPLTDEQIDKAIIDALTEVRSPKLWQALTHESGPYSIDVANHDTRRFARALLSRTVPAHRKETT